MGKNLYEAQCQWAVRPPDQRFWTLDEMRSQCAEWRSQAKESQVVVDDLKFIDLSNNELGLTGPQGEKARFTYHGFSRMASLVGAPADYLRSLPSNLAAQNLQIGLAQREDKGRDVKLLLHKNGGLLLRSVTSEAYTRIWNLDVVDRLSVLVDGGWKVPPARPALGYDPRSRPATPEDVVRCAYPGSLGIHEGDMIAPAGLYASDADMFAFLVNDKAQIDDGSGNILFRGLFVENSEIGGKSCRLTYFLFESVCGNHIVWNATGVSEVKIVHRGRADERVQRELVRNTRRYLDAAPTEQGLIKTAKTRILGKNQEEVVDTIFAKRLGTRGDLNAAYVKATEHEEDHRADPRSVWGMVGGITRLSKETSHADKRVALDRLGGRVMQIAF